MQRIYQNLLKEGNGNKKYLRCPDILYNNFGVMCSATALDRVDLVYEDTVKDKLTINDSGFIK